MIMAQPKALSVFIPDIENSIERLMPQASNMQKNIFEACRYSILAGGKRLRPTLCLFFYHLFGGQAPGAVDFAAAIEMIHSYSLIHDDLPCMDDSDLRRGKPSCHKVYGYSTAVLAGDALLNRAFEVMTSSLEGIDPASQLRAAGVMSYESGAYGMVGGQVIDLAIEGHDCTEAQLWTMVDLKTAALISGACKSGALLAGASEKDAQAAYEYGRNIGLAFQIRDDMLDAQGENALLGKPTGEDEKNGKNTFVSKYGMAKCEELIKELTDKAISAVKDLDRAEDLGEIAFWLSGRSY